MQILPGGGERESGFVCGSLRCSGCPPASRQGEEGDCPENDLTLRRDRSLTYHTKNLCSKESVLKIEMCVQLKLNYKTVFRWHIEHCMQHLSIH